MKTAIKFLTILVLLSSSQVLSQSPDPDVQEIINRTSLDSLLKFVNELSGEVSVVVGGVTQTITSRNKNYPGNNIAAAYLKEKLQGYGLNTFEQSFSATGKNIYAVKQGTTFPNLKYIICGHFDSMPNGAIAPGADDNASGTALVIEAARILKDIPTKYTIVFALWDEEEQGLIGSKFYADSASRNSENIAGVLNFDMIAYDGNGDGLMEIHTRASSITLSDKMIETNNIYGIGLVSSIINPGLTSSDHSSFWNRNYQAILLIENYFGDFNPRYHTTGDRIQYFNGPYFLKCAKLGLGTLAALADVENVVPVELTSFTANSGQNKITLNWTTASELNNYGFEIEKRINKTGSEWLLTGFVSGTGTSSNMNEYSFTDVSVQNGTEYHYRLKQIDFNGNINYSKELLASSYPVSFELSQNYPNPFNPVTVISWQLPYAAHVSLKIYNSIGQEIKTLINEFQQAGPHSIVYSVISTQTSGIYFYTLNVEEQSFTRKMTFLK